MSSSSMMLNWKKKKQSPEQEKLFTRWKDELKTYLLVCKTGVEFRGVESQLTEIMGKPVPYKEMGIETWREFLFEARDVFELCKFPSYTRNNQRFLFLKQYTIADEQAHIQSMIKGQEKAKTRKNKDGTVKEPSRRQVERADYGDLFLGAQYSLTKPQPNNYQPKAVIPSRQYEKYSRKTSGNTEYRSSCSRQFGQRNNKYDYGGFDSDESMLKWSKVIHQVPQVVELCQVPEFKLKVVQVPQIADLTDFEPKPVHVPQVADFDKPISDFCTETIEDRRIVNLKISDLDRNPIQMGPSPHSIPIKFKEIWSIVSMGPSKLLENTIVFRRKQYIEQFLDLEKKITEFYNSEEGKKYIVRGTPTQGFYVAYWSEKKKWIRVEIIKSCKPGVSIISSFAYDYGEFITADLRSNQVRYMMKECTKVPKVGYFGRFVNLNGAIMPANTLNENEELECSFVLKKNHDLSSTPLLYIKI